MNHQQQIRHTPEPHGRIVDFITTAEWDYVSGDAVAAYGDLLDHYYRHVAFIKPDLIVLYDEIVSREPATFQFMLHAESPFEVVGEEGALHVEHGKAGVDVRYLSPVELSFRQWDGYEPPPERRQFPNQWHVEAGTIERVPGLDMLTVVVPYPSGARKEWRVEQEESRSAIGLRFTRDEQQIVVAFRKRAADGEAAELSGKTFVGPLSIQKIDTVAGSR